MLQAPFVPQGALQVFITTTPTPPSREAELFLPTLPRGLNKQHKGSGDYPLVPRGDYTMYPQNAKLLLPNSSLYNQPGKHSTDVSLLQAPALCSAQDSKVCPASLTQVHKTLHTASVKS